MGDGNEPCGCPLIQQKSDVIETAGIKAPGPVLVFLYLIGITIIGSRILALAGVNATGLIAEPVPGSAAPNH